MEEERKSSSSLRKKILTSVGALILLSLLGSTISLFRITEVNRSLDSVNRVTVPLGGILVQLKGDAEILEREMEAKIGYRHWQDPHWRPQPMPHWIRDILENQIDRIRDLLADSREWATADSKTIWRDWGEEISEGLEELKALSTDLYSALEQKNYAAAGELYPKWSSKLGDWHKKLEWGIQESKQLLKQSFQHSESTVSQLRTGLQMILVVVVFLSFLLLWLGERTLRPLADLTHLARKITQRGLRKEDKSELPALPIGREDEVSQLAREFHSMATALLEREKTVQNQKDRLKEQNRLLQEIGALNENVLNSIESAIIVTDLEARITQINPVANLWLVGRKKTGKSIFSFELVQFLIEDFISKEKWQEKITELSEGHREGPKEWKGRYYDCRLMPLRQGGQSNAGLIIIIEDVSEEIDIHRRLQIAENLAAIGRMSAQVAHEIRNPLHSIGLEAEMALEMTQKEKTLAAKESVQSILKGVERLESITENYLRLSRPSSEKSEKVDLREVLESTLATYGSACHAQRVSVDWSVEKSALTQIWGDRVLLEQVFGNLMKNSIQAMEEQSEPKVAWKIGNTETSKVWIRIDDNGRGVSEDEASKLFTPFFTTKAQGTGLGLPFVQKVVTDHGGKVTYSRSDLGGARFEIVLPVLAQEKRKQYKRYVDGENSIS